MSHTTISPLLIQLFEAESRIVDQLLAQNQDGKLLRKPVCLQGRTVLFLPQGPQATGKSAGSVKVCQGSSHDNVKVQAPKPTHQDMDSSLSETFSLTASSSHTGEMDSPLVQLTGSSFTVQDPVSTAIDALHSDILSRAEKPKNRLTKPKWLSVNSNARLSNNGSSSVLAARISESVPSPAPTSQEDHDILSNSLTQQNLLDFQNRKNTKPEPSIQSGRCYNLRKRKSSIELQLEEREPVVESSAPKRRRILNGSHHVLDTVEATTVSELPASVPDDSVGGQTKGKTYQNTWQKPRVAGMNHERQTGKQVKSEPRKRSAAVQTARQILRRRRRVVVGRSTNLLCMSCKHGVISTECQICALTRTDSKKNAASLKTVRKAHTLKKDMSLQKQSNAVNKKSSNLISSKARNKMLSRIGQSSIKNMKAKQSGLKVKCSLKQSRQPTSRSAKSLNLQSKIKCTVRAIAKKNRAVKANATQSKSKSINTKAVLSESKTNSTNAIRSEAKSNSERTIPLKAKSGCASRVQSDPKGKKASTVHSNSKADSTKAVLNSIIEHHKQLSYQSQAAEDELFSSTKDMFSQLCQLHERSKEYDASVLDTIMPAKQAHGERVFTKPSSVYSSARHSAHIGGIWKSIFTER